MIPQELIDYLDESEEKAKKQALYYYNNNDIESFEHFSGRHTAFALIKNKIMELIDQEEI